MAKSIFTPAVSAIIAEDIDIKLKLWHGINLPLLLSVLTLVLGVTAFVAQSHTRRLLDRLAGEHVIREVEGAA